MTPPLVSVVMPFRDVGRYVTEAAESILSQTVRDLELIAVDDGSTDGSREALARLASEPRLRVATQARLGLVAALNHGLRLARGRFVARMDADDVSLPQRLERQLEFLERHPQVAVVGSAIRVLTDAGPTGRVVSLPVRPEDVRAALPHLNPLSHPTVLMRREALVRSGGYRPAFEQSEDYDLWLRLAEQHDLANLAEPLLLYRRHAVHRSVPKLERQALALVAARECARLRRLGQPDPADHLAEPVSWEFLIGLGLDRELIGGRVAGHLRDAVQQLLEAGLLDDALHLAQALAAERRTGRLGGKPAAIHAQLALFRVESARARPLRALGHLLRWLLVAPDDVPPRVARACLRLPSALRAGIRRRAARARTR